MVKQFSQIRRKGPILILQTSARGVKLITYTRSVRTVVTATAKIVRHIEAEETTFTVSNA
jgi:hypothetical protein